MHLLKFTNLHVKLPGNIVFHNINWEINKYEHWIITGKTGSGKTSFLKMLQGVGIVENGEIYNHLGKQPEFGLYELQKHIAFVFFLDQEINYHNFYYQQRYYSTEVEGTQTAHDFLWQGIKKEDRIPEPEMFESLGLTNLLSKELIKLSNGETRRLFIAKALLKKPRLLVLDNPYMGLDTDARQTLNHLLNEIAKIGIHFIIADSGADYPSCMTHVLVMDQFKIESVSSLSHTLLSFENNSNSTKLQKEIKGFSLPEKNFPFALQKEVPCNNFNIAVGFSRLTIKYDEQVILNDINWTIKQGDKWALTGRNGAGKSMLLSVIFADHPQAYANNIVIFDRHRGSGETIWDIKERIGYVSPELHFYFEQQISCEDAVLGVLNEHPYNRKSPEPWHYQLFDNLLAYYNISNLRHAGFHSLSTGQQRLMLLLRTIIKNPPLLLLDEPFQGFDTETIEKSKLLLDHFCINRTLVFVSHLVNEIPSIISHSARLENGIIML